MDLEEWELLSDEGFIDLHEDHGVNTTISTKPKSNTTTLIDMNYFHKFSEPQKKRDSGVIPVPIKFDEKDENFEEIPAEEVTKLPIESSQPTDHKNDMKDQNFGVLGPKSDDDQEMISKIFFKKLKETNEFVDMKIDSPPPRSLNRGFMPQVDVGTYQFDEKDQKDCNFDEKKEKHEEGSDEITLPLIEEMSNLKSAKLEDVVVDDDDHKNEGLNVWKLAMTGMGALISFGFAAATVSFIVFTNRHKESNHSKKKDLHFQIYSHDKRFKQVVRRATKLNEAISVMRGAPITRAHITIGGYYEGL